MKLVFMSCIVLLRKVQSKGSNKSTHCLHSQVIKEITTFLRSKGIKAEGSANNPKAFADVFAELFGKPLEVKLIAKPLSPAQSQYKRSVESAGAFYVVVTNTEDFKAWYRETLKTAIP